jgi:hypothetical protein
MQPPNERSPKLTRSILTLALMLAFAPAHSETREEANKRFSENLFKDVAKSGANKAASDDPQASAKA